jgi:hypothetical protein
LSARVALDLFAAPRQALNDGGQHDIDLEGLQDVVIRPRLHRVDRGVDRSEAGHHDRERVGVQTGDLGEQLQTPELRHLQVADDDIVLAV